MGFLSKLFSCLRSEKATESPSQPAKPVALSSQDETVNGTQKEPVKASSPADVAHVAEEPKETTLEQGATTAPEPAQSHDLTSQKAKEPTIEPETATAGSQADAPTEKSPEVVVPTSDNAASQAEETTAETPKEVDTAVRNSSTVETHATEGEPVTKMHSTDEANVPDLVPDLSTTTSDDHHDRQHQQQQQQQQQQPKSSRRKSLARIFSKRQSESTRPNLQIPLVPKKLSNPAISPITPASSTSATAPTPMPTTTTMTKPAADDSATDDYRLEGRKWKENADNDSLYCY